jgi:thiol-disulfide isomerase/thioredoxin
VEIWRSGEVVKITEITDETESNYTTLNYLSTPETAVTYSQWGRDPVGKEEIGGSWNNGGISISHFRQPTFHQLIPMWLMTAGGEEFQKEGGHQRISAFPDGPKIELHEHRRVVPEANVTNAWPDGFCLYSEPSLNASKTPSVSCRVESWTNCGGVVFPAQFSGTTAAGYGFRLTINSIEALSKPVDTRLPVRSIVTDWRPQENGRLLTGCNYDIENGIVFRDVIDAHRAGLVDYTKALDWEMSNAPQPGAVAIGDIAPEIDADFLDSGHFKLSKMRGKIVVLDFWSIECAPCVGQLPEFHKVYSALRSDNRFAFVGVNLGDDKDALRSFVKKKNVDWPQIIMRDGFDDPTVKRFGINGIPSVLTIDGEGHISDKSYNISTEFLKGLAAKNSVPQINTH